MNPNTQTREFSLRHPDGYYVTISALSLPDPREDGLTSACSRPRCAAESTSHGRDVRALAVEALVVRCIARSLPTSVCRRIARVHVAQRIPESGDDIVGVYFSSCESGCPASLGKRGSFRSGSHIGSSRSSAGVSATLAANELEYMSHGKGK